MKTHENRALFSRALLKATTCLFLTAGAGVSSAMGSTGRECPSNHRNSTTKSALSMVRLQTQMENPSLVPVL